MVEGGWHRVRSIAVLFVKEKAFEVCLLHGDDFICVSPLEWHAAMDELLLAIMECNILAKVLLRWAFVVGRTWPILL